MARQTAGMLRLNADIPGRLHFEFKKACLVRGESMTDVLTQFITKYVEVSKKPKRK